MAEASWKRVVVAGLVAASSGGCLLKTDVVPAAYNGGALGAPSDPFRDPAMLAASRVERILEQELADGYFQQGAGGKIGDWLDGAAKHPERFRDIVSRICGGLGGTRHAATGTSTDTSLVTREEFSGLFGPLPSSKQPFCAAAQAAPPSADAARSSGTPDTGAIELFVDQVRLKQALARAARRVAALRLEGLVDDTAVLAGAAEGFERTASYLGNRRWKRSEQRKTAALAVEGGAATGIFSAGVVWVTLQLIDGWMTAHPCANGDDDDGCAQNLSFRLISGTSTGAMVSVATDRFSAEKTHAGRKREIDHIAEWFTCYSFSDLMCVQSRGIEELFGTDAASLRGVLRFDGIQKVLTSCVKPWMFSDPAELILNTTEFRTGRIFSLSDQNELRLLPGATASDTASRMQGLVQAALASALLPVIGEPAVFVQGDHSRFDVPYDSKDLARTAPSYLDGGIRSELPILPLVRRGAERVLAVGSGSSMVNEVSRIPNAIQIATRYIDVNTGAVTETEIDYAQRLAESMRLAEIDACMSALDTPDGREVCDDAPKNGKPFCSRFNVCHDDLKDACTFVDGADYEKQRAADDHKSLTRRLEPFWRMATIFLDQTNVDGLAGYDFRPSALRNLFRAGAEAARVRCLDIASLLGVLPSGRAPTADEIRDVNRWCNASMEPVKTTCQNRVPSDAAFQVRACNDPVDFSKLPAYLDACPGAEAPQ